MVLLAQVHLVALDCQEVLVHREALLVLVVLLVLETQKVPEFRYLLEVLMLLEVPEVLVLRKVLVGLAVLLVLEGQ